MACLHFCLQIKRHPSFKKFFYEPSVSSLRKLVATLRSRGAHATEPKRTYPFVFGLGNQGAGNNYHTVLSLTGLQYRRSSYGQFPYEKAQQVRTGPVARGVTDSDHKDLLCVLSPPLLSSGLVGSSSNATSLSRPSETILYHRGLLSFPASPLYLLIS